MTNVNEDDSDLRLRQNLAALITHEKFGHGFFFRMTKLGQQLSILCKHGLVPDGRSESLVQKAIYTKHERDIRAVWDSALIVNEGFATWAETALLPILSPDFSCTPERRKTLAYQDDKLHSLCDKSDYFKAHPPKYLSRYREGTEVFEQIQNAASGDGFYEVVEACKTCANIDFGISEVGGNVNFTMKPGAIAPGHSRRSRRLLRSPKAVPHR